jgi:hypothetical protein
VHEPPTAACFSLVANQPAATRRLYIGSGEGFCLEMSTQNDPLLKQADCLVEVAQINAVALCQSARKHFLFLQDVNVKHWDSILTIAGIFMAANRLKNLRLNDQREQMLMKRIAERLAQWEPSYAIRGFEDCKSFFERAFDSLRATTSDLLHLTLSVHGSS